MKLTKEQVQNDLNGLPEHYKTADVDQLIRRYVQQKADVSALRPYILTQQQLHRIYYYVSLKQIKDVQKRMAFIHENLLFSDWWHTDQVISFVSTLDFEVALDYAKVCSLMEIEEYPDLTSIFEVTKLDVFCDIKGIIRSHPDFEEVNLACSNRYLSTGLKWYEKYLNEIAQKKEPNEVTPVETYDKEKFLSEVFMTPEQYDELVDLLAYKKNVILQGAPGVGKTFLAKRLAYSILGKKDASHIEMVQFHQSYSYEDFMMG